MNALDLFGGPGAATGSTVAGAGILAVPAEAGDPSGGFEAMMAKALLAQDAGTGAPPATVFARTDAAIDAPALPDFGDGADADTDAGKQADESGPDLSLLLAMSGGLIGPIYAPAAADTSAESPAGPEPDAALEIAAAAPASAHGAADVVVPATEAETREAKVAVERPAFAAPTVNAAETAPAPETAETAGESVPSTPPAVTAAPLSSPAGDGEVPAPEVSEAYTRGVPAPDTAAPSAGPAVAPALDPSSERRAEAGTTARVGNPAGDGPSASRSVPAGVRAIEEPLSVPPDARTIEEEPAPVLISKQPLDARSEPSDAIRPGQATRQAGELARTAGKPDEARRQAVAALEAALAPVSQPAEVADVPAHGQVTQLPSNGRMAAPVQGKAVAGNTPGDVNAAPVAAGTASAAVAAYQASGPQTDSGPNRESSAGRSNVAAAAAGAGPKRTEGISTAAGLVIPDAAGPATKLPVEAGQPLQFEPTGPNVAWHESAQNVQLLVRSARLLAEGGGEARLQLTPEHLGPVTLTVRVQEGRVSAHIQAATAEATQWIETYQQDLRGALRDQGLDVKEVVVTTDPDGRRERDQPPDKRRPSRRLPEGASAPRFEVVV